MMEFIHSPYSAPAAIVLGLLYAVYMSCSGSGWTHKACGDFILTLLGMIALMTLIATAVVHFGRPY